jgi:tetratricopeptide (TPR) repeat protein
MEDPLILARQRRERRQERKELAVKSCYSLIIVLGALVLLRPLMVDQILSRAEAYAAAGRAEECQRQCDKALLIDDDNSSAWCQLARLYKSMGDRTAAYAAYEKAARADATNRTAHYELALMYVEDSKHQMAIPYLEQVRRLGPERGKIGVVERSSYHQDALAMLILCYRKVGDSDKTELNLKEMRVLYPGYGNAGDPLPPFAPNNSRH